MEGKKQAYMVLGGNGHLAQKLGNTKAYSNSILLDSYCTSVGQVCKNKMHSSLKALGK